MEKIEISKSNKKISLLLAGSLVMIFLGFLMIRNPDKFISFIFRSEYIIRISGIISVIFFGLVFISIIKKLLNSKQRIGIIVDDSGINDNSSAVSVGLIEWRDIKGIRRKNVLSTKFLLIDVYEPSKYIIRAKNKFISNLLKSNVKAYDTPISISSNALKCNFEELFNILEERRKYFSNQRKE